MKNCLLVFPAVLFVVTCAGCWDLPGNAPLAPLPPELQGKIEDLVGTTWTIKEYTVTFHEPPRVHVSGGEIDLRAPEGADGEYSLKDGIIEIAVMDESRMGYWYGDRLVIDDDEAVKKE